MEKQKNTPQLRFSEFQDEWVVEQLSDIATRIGDGIHGTPHYDEEGDYFFINGNNLMGGSIYITENTKRINSDEFRMHRRDLNERTILLSINGTIGNIAYYHGEAVILGKSAAYININKIHDLTFSFYSLMTNRIQSYFNSELTGTTIKNLSLKTIRNTKLFIPILPEQQKIASFFTAIDQKISQLKRKKTLLEQYKKGVMQKIFSQEIRFRDENGQEFPKWEKKKLGEVYSFRGNNSFSRENLNYEKGDVKNIHYGDIHTKFNTLFDIAKEEIPYINEDLPIERISVDNYCKEGDLIFADASEDLADVGKSIELLNLNNEKVLSGLHTILARPNLSKMALGFGGYLMKSDAVRKQIMKEAQGSKVSSISATKLSVVQLNIPIQKEQTKIVNFLSAIDDKISRTQKKIAKAEEWKKGLMQQMFV